MSTNDVTNTSDSNVQETKTYRVSEAAKILGRHPKTLQVWDRKGYFTTTRDEKNQRIYTQEQIDNFIERRKGQMRDGNKHIKRA